MNYQENNHISINFRSGNSAGKIATLRSGHRGSVFCLAINGDAIVSGSFDHTICVWDRQGNGKFPLVQRLNKTDIQHTDMIYGVAINIFNQIVSSSHDSTVSVWQYHKRNVREILLISYLCHGCFISWKYCLDATSCVVVVGFLGYNKCVFIQGQFL